MTHRQSIRLFEPTTAEYEAIVHVYNIANPLYPGSPSGWRHWDQHREPSRLFTRYVVERQGEIGGYGYSVRTDVEANMFRFAINLLPEWETAELIYQFYSYIMEMCLDFEPTGLICQTREDETKKINWLRKQEFQEKMRYPTSTLNVSEFELDSCAELRVKNASRGLEIISLAELAERDPEWQRKVYDLEMLLNQDVPRPTAFTPPAFDKYAKSEFGDPDFTPDLWLIALDGAAYVGTTSLFKSGDSAEMLETDLTGVHRDYRRRGLALALKCQGIEIAQRLGSRLIVTSNEENNPMFQLNLRLGFQAQPADVDWETPIPATKLDSE